MSDQILAQCRYCDDVKFVTWPEALDHAVLEHATEIAKRHPTTGLEVIDRADREENMKGRIPR